MLNIYASMDRGIYGCKDVCMPACVCVCVGACVSMFVPMYLYMYASVFLCIYVLHSCLYPWNCIIAMQLNVTQWIVMP